MPVRVSPSPIHEQRRDQHHIGIAEPRQGFRHADDAGQRQDDDCQQGDHIHSRLIYDKQPDTGDQRAQNQEQISVHPEALPIISSEPKRQLAAPAPLKGHAVSRAATRRPKASLMARQTPLPAVLSPSSLEPLIGRHLDTDRRACGRRRRPRETQGSSVASVERRGLPRYAQSSAIQRSGSVNRSLRPPFACGEGDLSLPKPVAGAVLGALIDGKREDPAMAGAATPDGGRDTDATAVRRIDGCLFPS